MGDHVIPWVVVFSLQNSYAFCSDVPWSLHRFTPSRDKPPQAGLRSDTATHCDTNIQMYAFTMTGLRMEPRFVRPRYWSCPIIWGRGLATCRSQ